MRVIIVFCSIVILWYSPVDSRTCYDCLCEYDWDTATGSCLVPGFDQGCTLKEVGNQYCRIRSYYTNNHEQRYFESVAPDIYQDSHFFEALESVSLSNTTWLPTATSYIAYGCGWDNCNHPSLALYLPDSFQMSINEITLNSELLNGQSSAESCNSCGGCISNITGYVCSLQPCTKGLCYIDEIHNYGPTNCTYNFYSSCQLPVDPSSYRPTVRIRAVYYIDLPVDKQLEIDEIDITCTKNQCNSIETVERLKGQIQRNITIHPDFRPLKANDTTTITTTTIEETTPPNHATIVIISRAAVFLYFILVFLLVEQHEP